MLENLIWILERSVEKNGEIFLTNRHLLNIIRMWERKDEYDREHEEDDIFEGLTEIEDRNNW